MADIASIQSALSKAKSAFTAKYKYKVLGQDDPLFKKVASSIGDDNVTAKLKRKKVAEIIAIRKIEATVADANLRDVAIAKEKAKFLNAAFAAIKDVEKLKKAKLDIDIVEGITQELSDNLDSYIDAKNQLGGLTAEEDRVFLSDVLGLEGKMDKMANRLEPRLRKDNIFFSLDLYKAKKAFNEIEEKIGNLNILV